MGDLESFQCSVEDLVRLIYAVNELPGLVTQINEFCEKSECSFVENKEKECKIHSMKDAISVLLKDKLISQKRRSSVEPQENFLNKKKQRLSLDKYDRITIMTPTLSKVEKVYIDGVFDLMHFGHFNGLYQAKAFGNKLCVGVNSDNETFLAKKSYPIFSHDERHFLMNACKWVDSVIPNAPYAVSREFFETTGCDVASHGDDIVLGEDETDCYQDLRESGQLVTFMRTRGVSTTLIISKILLSSTDPLNKSRSNSLSYIPKKSKNNNSDEDVSKKKKKFYSATTFSANSVDDINRFPCVSLAQLSNYLSDAYKMTQASKLKNARNGDQTVVVYVEGFFDVIQPSHITFLEKAKSLGDFLLVGVYDDATAKRRYGDLYPIHTLFSRVLFLIGLRAVDDVVLAAPTNPTKLFLKFFNISKIVRPASEIPNEKETQTHSYPVTYIPNELEVESIATRILERKADLLPVLKQKYTD